MSADPKEKIKTLRQLKKIAAAAKQQGKILVHCHGVFDLIHPGHIRHFASAKKKGDILIVTITSDGYVKKGPGRPVFPQTLRAEVLASIQHIDYVSIVDAESGVLPIKTIRPNIYAKGPDYKNRKPAPGMNRKLEAEAQAVISVKGKLICTDDSIVFSSSNLINTFWDNYPQKTKQYMQRVRKKYTADEIREKLQALARIKAVVIGDAIIDQYCYCLPLGKSSKEPIIVHRYESEESFAGGTLATANHMAALVGSTTLVTVLGKKKSYEWFIRKHLAKNITPQFIFQSNASTIVKRRYLDAFSKQKLFQISYLKNEMVREQTERALLSFLKKNLRTYDMVVVNDFGHGMITEKIREYLASHAPFLALNVQANSANYGFNVVTKYPRADFVCIDEQEMRLALHDKYGSLHELIRTMYKKMKCSFSIITRGFEGSISYVGAEKFEEAPALTERIVDRVGAGDALFAITAPCVFAGWDQELVTFIGNIAGALKVQTVGNKRPIAQDDICRYITTLLK